MPAKTTPALKRFELPALNFKFEPLTAGTNIPPPLPSPVQETAPVLPAAKTPTAATKSAAKPAPAPAARPATRDAPMSPGTAARHGPLRRLLSRSFMTHAYADDNKVSTTSLVSSVARPDSRSAGSVTDEKKAKRRSGWFQRLRSSDTMAKRSSLIFDEPKKTGPPPPMIPELSTVETKIDLGNAGTISDESFFSGLK
ncbi:hypothetical protein TD95_001326 [Thielaviopsis punctulata]|uniref:Uncharacterized protein n=1 Tax=Thielaviopsis punctulata TaxID=72032 RepID=A0A0F4ZK92_9PEZI|nr:hypothetical protein TD95_001326 [Thielaviopsis punctulata]